jgi:hypothetical protein
MSSFEIRELSFQIVMSSVHQHTSPVEEPLPPYAIQVTTIPPLFTDSYKRKKPARPVRGLHCCRNGVLLQKVTFEYMAFDSPLPFVSFDHSTRWIAASPAIHAEPPSPQHALSYDLLGSPSFVP